LANKENRSIWLKSILLALLSFLLAMAETALIRSDAQTCFAEEQQGGDSFFQNAKAGDEREVGGVKLRWCPPGRFVMCSPPEEPGRRLNHISFRVVAVQW